MKRRERETVLAVAPPAAAAATTGVDEEQPALPQVIVHNIPCRIEHDGPARVSAFFKCKVDASPTGLVDQPQIKGCFKASFRGRELRGVELGLPEELRGLVVEEDGGRDGDDTEDDLLDEEESEIWDDEGGSETKRPRVRRSAQITAEFSRLTYWQREEEMTLDSIPIQWLSEWLPLNLAINKAVSLEQMQAIDFDALPPS